MPRSDLDLADALREIAGRTEQKAEDRSLPEPLRQMLREDAEALREAAKRLTSGAT